MSQTIPAAEKNAAPRTKQPLVPPDERFWQRYSPHGELPLSSAGSLALHLLVLGLMVLSALWLSAIFGHANRSLPVEAVRLDAGGGGGNPHGGGDDPNRGRPPEEVGDPKAEDQAANPNPVDTPEPLKLDVKPASAPPIQFDQPAIRMIQQTDTASSQAMQKLAKANIRVPLPDRPKSSPGKGGTGSGGGSGGGKGPGIGDSSGEGSSGKLTQREKRMLRWSMLFNTTNARDYLSQLQGLGAILAIPVEADANAADAPEKKYKVIHNLSARPVKLVSEDVRKLNRIFWADDNATSVQDVMALLGVRLRPNYFVAFMPQELEQKLYQMEKDYLEKHYPGRREDDIVETKFRINRSGNKYEPVMREERGEKGSAMKVKAQR